MENTKYYTAFEYDAGPFEAGRTYAPADFGLGHFMVFTDPARIFAYFGFDDGTRVLEVVPGTLEENKYDAKSWYCKEITAVREIPWHEVLRIANDGSYNIGYGNKGNGNTGIGNDGNGNSNDNNCGSRNTGHGNRGYGNAGSGNSGDGNTRFENIGNLNSGDHNIGSCNSGNDNLGDWNSGVCNCGDFNSGSYNLGDRHTGHFNTGTAPLMMFNKPVPDGVEPDFPGFFQYVNMTVWVHLHEMDDEERRSHAEYETTEGYLHGFGYREAWKAAFEFAREDMDWAEEKRKLLALPNFDYGIFEEITGITKEMIER